MLDWSERQQMLNDNKLGPKARYERLQEEFRKNNSRKEYEDEQKKIRRELHKLEREHEPKFIHEVFKEVRAYKRMPRDKADEIL